MFKSLAIAALVGATSAQWTKTIVPTVYLTMGGFNYYNFMISASADAALGTLYNPTPPVGTTHTPDMS